MKTCFFCLFVIAVTSPLLHAQRENLLEVNNGKPDQEITAHAYCDFLNTATSTEAYHLYDEKMNGIVRSRSPGCYHYETIKEQENAPVTFISSLDATHDENCLENSTSTCLFSSPLFFTGTSSGHTTCDRELKSNRLILQIAKNSLDLNHTFAYNTLSNQSLIEIAAATLLLTGTGYYYLTSDSYRIAPELLPIDSVHSEQQRTLQEAQEGAQLELAAAQLQLAIETGKLSAQEVLLQRLHDQEATRHEFSEQILSSSLAIDERKSLPLHRWIRKNEHQEYQLFRRSKTSPWSEKYILLQTLTNLMNEMQRSSQEKQNSISLQLHDLQKTRINTTVTSLLLSASTQQETLTLLTEELESLAGTENSPFKRLHSEQLSSAIRNTEHMSDDSLRDARTMEIRAIQHRIQEHLSTRLQSPSLRSTNHRRPTIEVHIQESRQTLEAQKQTIQETLQALEILLQQEHQANQRQPDVIDHAIKSFISLFSPPKS